jgi:hypothetical protein
MSAPTNTGFLVRPTEDRLNWQSLQKEDRRHQSVRLMLVLHAVSSIPYALLQMTVSN